MLVDLPVNGETRKALVTTGKLGIIEAIDRTNGEWLWHKETVPQNVVAAIDPKTGAKTINDAVMPHIGQTATNCPANPGARGWPATAYSPKTGMLYLPLNEFCSNIDAAAARSRPGLYRRRPRGLQVHGACPTATAISGASTRSSSPTSSTAWSHRQRAPSTSAVLPTGGGVVFAGDIGRYFRAFDDTTGQVLWQMRTNNVVNAFPVSYSVNGKQYVAVATGGGSGFLRSVSPAGARDQESGRRLDALGVRAAGLIGPWDEFGEFDSGTDNVCSARACSSRPCLRSGRHDGAPCLLPLARRGGADALRARRMEVRPAPGRRTRCTTASMRAIRIFRSRARSARRSPARCCCSRRST